MGGQNSIESGQIGGLDFDDHMAQLQQGRSRYRIYIPTLHVNSIGNETQQRIPQTLSVESERPRRVGLRSAGTWEQRSHSQYEFNMRIAETIIGGSQNVQSVPISTVGTIRCSQRRGVVKKTCNMTDATLKQAMDAVTD